MAVQVNFEKEDMYLKDAYLRIKKVMVVDGVRERFEEQENGDLHLKYDKYFEGNAIVYVYSDKEARDRNVMPTHHFGIEFAYDPNTDTRGVYELAYTALKSLERFVDEEVVDV